MNINKTNTVAGVQPTAWPTSQRDPTFAKLNTEECDGFVADCDGSALSASQRLFIKAMRYLEENENEIVIEALELPHTYTGQTLPVLDRITTENQWNENLEALLNAIEQETGRPFADRYITRLCCYNFVDNGAVSVYKPMKTHEDHNGP